MSLYLALIIAAVLLALIPLAPKILRFRIRVLRWIHFNWLANHMESHFPGWVLFVRVFLVVIIGIVLSQARW